MNRLKCFAVVSLFLVPFSVSGASTVSVDIPANQDSYVDTSKTSALSANYGSDTSLNVAKGKPERALIQFDTGSIPAGATVQSASIKLVMYDTPATKDARTYEVYRNTASWLENSVTWNTRPATSSTLTSSTLIPLSVGTVSFDVTGDVAAFVAGTETNGGWTIRDSAESNSVGNEAKFRSREYATSSLRPVLEVTYVPANSAPVVTDESVSTHENTVKNISLSATDADNDTLSYSIVASPTNGAVVLSGNMATYTPNTGFIGTDTFTYKANDGSVDSNTATVSVTVSNNSPVITAISDQAIPELSAFTLTAHATDSDTDPLTYVISGLPTGASFDTASGTLSWTPTEDQGPGDYPVTISATDGTAMDGSSFIIHVTEVNTAPAASDVSATTDENTPAVIGLSATDSDLPAQSLSYMVVTAPAHGSAAVSGDTVTYTPDANWSGTDTFTYKANDGTADSNTATVTITVNPVNQVPTITLLGDATTTVTQGDTFTDPGATATDTEDGDISASIVVTGSVGTSVLGTTTLVYTVTDSGGLSASTTRTVIVNAAAVTVTPTTPSTGGGNSSPALGNGPVAGAPTVPTPPPAPTPVPPTPTPAPQAINTSPTSNPSNASISLPTPAPRNPTGRAVQGTPTAPSTVAIASSSQVAASVETSTQTASVIQSGWQKFFGAVVLFWKHLFGK